MFNTLLPKNVLPAQEVALPKAQNLLAAITVVEKVRSEQIKDFLQYNKLVRNAVAMVKQ